MTLGNIDCAPGSTPVKTVPVHTSLMERDNVRFSYEPKAEETEVKLEKDGYIWCRLGSLK